MIPQSLRKLFQASPQYKLPFFGMMGCLLLLVAFLAFRPLYALDLGLHLRPGQWILENLQFPQTDIFTYTVPDNRYIDLYWLYQAILAVVHQIGGMNGILVLNVLMIVGAFELMSRRCFQRQRSPLLLYGLLFFLVANASFYELRPHVFSWVYLNLLLLILEEYYHTSNKKLLYFLPFLMLFWANSHTLFILGWVVMGAYIGGSFLEQKQIDKKLLLFSGIAVLICFVNPWFYEGVMLPFTQFGFLQDDNLYKQGISEYTSPFSSLVLEDYHRNGRFVLFQPTFYLHFLIIAYTLIFLLSLITQFKKMRWHEVALFALFWVVQMLAIKNSGYFLMATTPLVLRWANEWRESASWNKWINEQITVGSMSVIAILSLLFILQISTSAYYIRYRAPLRFGYGIDPLNLPVGASQFLQQNKLDGKLLNHLNYGGYFMLTLPQKIFIDGRNEVIGQEFYREYSQMQSAEGKTKLIQKYKPQIIAFPYDIAPSWVLYLKESDDWRLVYADQHSAIYLQKEYAPHVPPLNAYSFTNQLPKLTLEEVDRMMREKEVSGFLNQFTQPQYYPQAELNLSVFCYYNDWLEAAVRISAEGLQKTTVETPELYLNLGAFFYKAKSYPQALYAYKRALESVENELAQRRVREIELGVAK